MTLNLGGLLAERASTRRRWRRASGRCARSGRLGAAELATALVNAANLFVQLGDPRQRAGRSTAPAAERQPDRDARRWRPAAFVEGDAERRAGRPVAAVAPLPRPRPRAFLGGASRTSRPRASVRAVEALRRGGARSTKRAPS